MNKGASSESFLRPCSFFLFVFLKGGTLLCANRRQIHCFGEAMLPK
jgi:hypothetical protein